MNSKKITRISINLFVCLLVLVEVFMLFLMYKSSNNKNVSLVNVSLNDEIESSDMLAIMVEQEDGSYKEELTWPPQGKYVYDSEKSGCIDINGNKLDGVLTYDTTNNIATVDTSKTTYCYLYFSFPLPDININDIDLTKLNTSRYIKSLNCGASGTASFNPKYQRLEFDNIISPAKCNLNYTSDTNEYTLLTKEISNKLATSTTNSGICSNETYTTQSTCEEGEGHWYYVSSTKGSNNEDAGIRYSGKQPSNWIWFNNELWRIIGIIPTKLSDGTETNLVKIIRADSIGGLAFHSAASNTIWGGTGNDDVNTLYTLLNTYYYGKDDATGASPCLGASSKSVLCNYKEIGISNSNTDYYGKMVKDVYWNVGTVSSSTKITNTYTTEAGTKSTVTGRIGLMNASDYGYAISGITYSSIGLSSLRTYAQNNWLYGEGYEWTLTPRSTAFVFYMVFSHMDIDFASIGYAVRPVLYLDASVYVVSGDGTESNPYQIGM